MSMHPAASLSVSQVSRGFAVAALLFGALGCETVPDDKLGQRIVWRVSVAERFVDRTADELVRLPTRFEGRETWWVSDDVLSVETRGGLPNGRVNESRTWILRNEGMVFTVDYGSSSARAIPYARFDEERRRRSRASMVATIRAVSTGSESQLGRYSGDLSTNRAGSRMRVSALPGREWLLSGEQPARIDWARFPLLAMGFEDVSELEARPLSGLLARRRPQSILMQPLPSGQVAVRLEYDVQSVRRILPSAALAELPLSFVELARERERALSDFDLLWGFWSNPETRPKALDSRGLRIRMESVAQPHHLALIEARLDESEEIEEIEELLHLLYVLDASVFDKWYRAACDSADLPRILTCVSVQSLRRADRALVEELGQILEDESLFEGLTADQKRETRSWFQGVRHWVAHRRPVKQDSNEPKRTTEVEHR